MSPILKYKWEDRRGEENTGFTSESMKGLEKVLEGWSLKKAKRLLLSKC
ncbi:MAG: hypothetical protein NTV15_01265 [Candidatus Bathyarchaeota archaeon]|nr:hypothetical protein [Candidatus Bathyarchaeota archaeon]